MAAANLQPLRQKPTYTNHLTILIIGEQALWRRGGHKKFARGGVIKKILGGG